MIKMPDPCCGGSLQRGARNIAIFQIIWNIAYVVLIGIVVLVFGLTALGLHLKGEGDGNNNATVSTSPSSPNSAILVKTSSLSVSENGTMEEEEEIEIAGFVFGGAIVFAVLGGIYIFYCLINIIVAVILLEGANKRNLKRTLGWLEFTVIVWMYNMFGLLTKIWNGVWVMCFLTLVDVFLAAYFIWVVWSYYKELKTEQESPAAVNWNVDEGAKV